MLRQSPGRWTKMDKLSLLCDILSIKYDYICPYLMMNLMKRVLLTLIVFLSTLAVARAQSVFIDGMVGVNQYFGGGTEIGAGTDLFLGTWFTPALAARLGWHGHFGKQVSSQVVRGDIMYNLISSSSQLGVIPFISVGGDFHKEKNHHLLFGAGCELAFGLADQLQLIIDMGLMSDFDPKDNSVLPYFCNPSMPVGIGIRYSFQ